MFSAALFTIARSWKQPKKLKNSIFHYSTMKKNKIMPFAETWMDLEVIILSEVRERQISYDIIYMWNLKYDTNELIYKTERDRHREQTCGCHRGGGWGRDGLGVWD